MNIVVSKTITQNEEFARWLKTDLEDRINLLIDDRQSVSQIRYLSNKLNIDVLKLLKVIAKSLVISSNQREFTIYTSKVKLHYGKSISDWENLITSGTLSIKGYPILRDLEKYYNDNVGYLYLRWSNGY